MSLPFYALVALTIGLPFAICLLDNLVRETAKVVQPLMASEVILLWPFSVGLLLYYTAGGFVLRWIHGEINSLLLQIAKII